MQPLLTVITLLLLQAACGDKSGLSGTQLQGPERSTPERAAPTGTEPSGADPRNTNTDDPNPTEPTALTYFNFAKDVIDRECVSCHGVPPIAGSPKTFRLDTYEDRDGVPGILTFAQRVKIRTVAKTMPPAGTGALTDEEVVKIAEWIDGGAPLGSPSSEHSETGEKASTTTSTTGETASTSSTAATATATALTYYNFAKGILDRECADCHGVPASEGAPNTLRLDTYADRDGIQAAYTLRQRIKIRVLDGTMPPPDTGTLTEEEAQKLIEWVNGGASEGVAEPAQLNPGLSFTSPPASGATADQSIEVEVSFVDVSADASWELYYSSSPGCTSGGVQIASAVPITTTRQTWNTGQVPDGVYSLYAILRDQNGLVLKSAEGSVLVSHPSPGNTNPTVTITAPNGGETLMVGTATQVMWSVSDPDPGDETAMTYDLEWSPDNGSNWITLMSDHAHTSFTWNIPTNQTRSQNYLVRITANDGKGGVAMDISDAAFEIGGAGLANPSYADFDAIAQTSCAGGGCHSNASGGKGDYTNNQASVDGNAASIKAKILANSMPKTGSLSASEKQTMVNYLDSVIP